jgi:hypothetical protein
VQRLALMPHFAEPQPIQTPSTHSYELQRDEQPPPPPLNPLRNSRMGEPIRPHQAPPPTLSHPPNTSVNQASSSGPSHSFPRPCPQPTFPPQLPKVRRKPRNMTTKGLKQSMGLHETSVGRHSYNRIRVRSSSIHRCFSTDQLLSQDRIRTKMKEKGEGLWVHFEDVPKTYKNWLVNEVSKPMLSPFL